MLQLQLSISEEVTSLACSSRLLCCGGAAGNIELRDTRSWRTEQRIATTKLGSSIAELDVRGDLMISTSFSKRG
jgi:hypothetical protein